MILLGIMIFEVQVHEGGVMQTQMHAFKIKRLPTMYSMPYWIVSPPLAICGILLSYAQLHNLSCI